MGIWQWVKTLIQIEGELKKMATKDEVKAAIAQAVAEVKTAVQTAIAKEAAEVAAAIKVLQDQITAGQPVTAEDLAEIVTSIQGIGTQAVQSIDQIQA